MPPSGEGADEAPAGDWAEDDAWLEDEWSGDDEESPSGSTSWSAVAPPPSGRALISGVEAGVAAGLWPSTSRDRLAAEGVGPRRGDRASAPEGGGADPPSADAGDLDGRASVVPLPDWTDPPTREVPRVLLDPSATATQISGPVWREVEADFAQDSVAFAELVAEAPKVAEHGTEPRDDEDDFDFGDAGGAQGGPRSAGLSESPPEGTEVEVLLPQVDAADAVSTELLEAGPAPTGLESFPRPNRRGAHVRHRQGPLAWTSQLASRPSPDRPGSGPDAGSPPEVPRRRRSPVLATATGIVFGAVTAGCFVAGPPLVLALACVVITVALAECYQGLRKAHYRPAALVGLGAAPGLMVAAYLKGNEAVPLIAALFLLLVFVWYLAGVTRQRPVANMAATVLGWVWIGGLGSFAALLLDPTAFPHRHGLAYLLGAIEATVGYDVGGYFFGSWLGKHKMASVISPNKTWEGLAGGCLTAFMVAIGITSHMSPWDLPRAALLGAVVAVFAPLGDLCESLVKRD
ncbi:MAG: phosphatidate cytidylyltransferase, partial [Acidimicrobiales bacterium]